MKEAQINTTKIKLHKHTYTHTHTHTKHPKITQKSKIEESSSNCISYLIIICPLFNS